MQGETKVPLINHRAPIDEFGLPITGAQRDISVPFMTGGSPEKTQDLRNVPHRSMIGTRRLLLGESRSLLYQPRI